MEHADGLEQSAQNIIMFANGTIHTLAAEVERWVRPGDLIVAVDGGTQHVLNADLKPTHIIGDLDSLPAALREDLEASGTVFRPHPPVKDETDLELALLWAVEQEAERIVILGALGGRPDQELANLLLLAMPALRGHNVMVADGLWTIWLLHGGERACLRGRPGDMLSLLPLGGDALGVKTQGLAYPLERETLAFGPARGVSNVFAGAEATVEFEKGLLWCFHKAQDFDGLRGSRSAGKCCVFALRR